MIVCSRQSFWLSLIVGNPNDCLELGTLNDCLLKAIKMIVLNCGHSKWLFAQDNQNECLAKKHLNDCFFKKWLTQTIISIVFSFRSDSKLSLVAPSVFLYPQTLWHENSSSLRWTATYLPLWAITHNLSSPSIQFLIWVHCRWYR